MNRASIRQLGRQGRQHPNQPRGKFLGHGPWFSHQNAYILTRIRRQAGAINNHRWLMDKLAQTQKET